MDEPERWRMSVTGHLDALVAESQSRPFIDVGLVEEIRARVGSVLDRWHEWDEAQRAGIGEFVTYLVDADDEEHDLLSPIGLVDDDERLRALEHRLGLR